MCSLSLTINCAWCSLPLISDETVVPRRGMASFTSLSLSSLKNKMNICWSSLLLVLLLLVAGRKYKLTIVKGSLGQCYQACSSSSCHFHMVKLTANGHHKPIFKHLVRHKNVSVRGQTTPRILTTTTTTNNNNKKKKVHHPFTIIKFLQQKYSLQTRLVVLRLSLPLSLASDLSSLYFHLNTTRPQHTWITSTSVFPSSGFSLYPPLQVLPTYRFNPSHAGTYLWLYPQGNMNS